MQALMLGVMAQATAQGLLSLGMPSALGQALGVTAEQAAPVVFGQYRLLAVQPGFGGSVVFAGQPQLQTQTAQLLGMPGCLLLRPVFASAGPEAFCLLQQPTALSQRGVLQVEAQQVLVNLNVRLCVQAALVQLACRLRV